MNPWIIMIPYTVIGVYADDNQPFAFHTLGRSPKDAIERATIDAITDETITDIEDFIVAGVIGGFHDVH